MTTNELKKKINQLASQYLGFRTEFGFGHRNKQELECAVAKLERINELNEQAKAIIGKYTKEQWNIAILFGTDNTGVADGDISKAQGLLRQANDLWITNLYEN